MQPEATTPQEPTPQGQVVSGAVEVENPSTLPPAEAPVDASGKIPSKFVDKSIDEVTEAYINLERELGRLRSEVGEKSKKLEEYEARQTYTTPQQPAVTQPIASQPVKSLKDQYEEEFSEDPKAAMYHLVDRVKSSIEQDVQSVYQRDFYENAKSGAIKGYEDMAELEPTMIALTHQFVDLIQPNQLSNPKLVKALHLMAKGFTSTDKIKKAEEKASRKADAVRTEKIASAPETPTNAGGSDLVDFDSLNREQMRKLLGVADRSSVD